MLSTRYFTTKFKFGYYFVRIASMYTAVHTGGVGSSWGLVHSFKWQLRPQYMSAYTDSDAERFDNPLQGGCMMHSRHMLRAYSKTQSNIALSSGEAEYYAMVKAASESMGLKAMVADFNREIEPWLYVDATAAMGVAQRVGLGKIRHLETQSLWLQKAVRNKRVGLAKVLGTMNPADAMTKALDSNTMNRLLALMGLEKREGCPEVAPMIEEDGDVNCVDEDGGTPSQSADKVVDERFGGSGLALRKTRLSKRRNMLEDDVLAGFFEHAMPHFVFWLFGSLRTRPT